MSDVKEVQSKLTDVKMEAFVGTTSILGPDRRVFYTPETGEDPSSFTIEGLSFNDVVHILGVLRGGVLTGKDAGGAKEVRAVPHPEATKPREQLPIDFTAKAKAKKAAPVLDEDEDAAEPTGAAEVAAATEAKPKANGFDLVYLAKQEKLRPVIEHFIERGHDTADKIVAAAKKLAADVPALAEVEKRGNFDKRIERAATIIISGDAAA